MIHHHIDAGLRHVKIYTILLCILLIPAAAYAAGRYETADDQGDSRQYMQVTDSSGREVTVPREPERVIGSGPGALRLLVYLDASERAVAADSIESREQQLDARPYAIANPQLSRLPLFGEFRGQDNPELILGLERRPQVIFKTYPESGYDPDELQSRTGIPVVTLNYGNLTYARDELYSSLRLMGEILGVSGRAEAVISFIEETIADLQSRAPEGTGPAVYVGGIAYKGPHGITSTEPAYPPFLFTGADHLAFDASLPAQLQQHAEISREQLLLWDPEYLFIDASTLQIHGEGNALEQITLEGSVFSHLQAVQKGNVYTLLPYNWYTQNIGSILADAYYVGTVLFPDAYADIDPAAQADEIYEFLVGAPVYAELDRMFDSKSLRKVLP